MFAVSIFALTAEPDPRPIPSYTGPLACVGCSRDEEELERRNYSFEIADSLDLFPNASIVIASPVLLKTEGIERWGKLIGPAQEVHRLRIAAAVGISEEGPTIVVSTVDHWNFMMAGSDDNKR
jgi:hypothetical protein